MTMFKIMFEAEGIHPLEGGIVRMKYRRDRRYGMKIEPFGAFHYKLALESWKKIKIYGWLAWQGWRIGQMVKNDPNRHDYMDLALSPRRRGGSRQARSVCRDGGRRGGAQPKRRGEDLARAKVVAAAEPSSASKPPNNLADRAPHRASAGAYDRVMNDETPNGVYR